MRVETALGLHRGRRRGAAGVLPLRGLEGRRSLRLRDRDPADSVVQVKWPVTQWLPDRLRRGHGEAAAAPAGVRRGAAAAPAAPALLGPLRDLRGARPRENRPPRGGGLRRRRAQRPAAAAARRRAPAARHPLRHGAVRRLARLPAGRRSTDRRGLRDPGADRRARAALRHAGGILRRLLLLGARGGRRRRPGGNRAVVIAGGKRADRRSWRRT